ncbi:MAG: bifunctional oligoribonuclease/PAP phosphatase NrnA [Lachnospiraceae bacterium]|nr:bifunctional oligoribonuclease/PAP phosphatase NrnA [Lachnospiraceae bacterium]
MFQDILEQIKLHDIIVIHRHTKPDGDAIGSQIGFKHLLTENFPDKKVYIVGDSAGNFSFIAGCPMDEIDDSVYAEALAVVLDCGGKHLVSDTRFETAKTTVRFDHHLFVEKFCDYEAVDSSYESCCGLLTRFAMDCNLTVSQAAATALFTGMVTDSGRFRYDSTTANTFALASFLMERSVDTTELYRNLYAEDFESKKRKSQFILKIQFTEHKVAYIYTTAQEVGELPMDAFTISRAMVGTMADMKDVDIWVNFTESEGKVLCELRSSRYNINPVAVKYGGGGHAKASGATVDSKEVAMQMLADLDLMAKEGAEQ